MPITLSPISRRRFLAGAAAAGAGLLLRPIAFGEVSPAVDPRRLVLLSDCHIDADVTVVDRAANMADQLSQIVKQIVALTPRPACVIVNGDCAHQTGTPEDYGTLVSLLKPLREAGMPIHLSLGNHDDRANFWKAIPDADQPAKAVADRQISVIESPGVDWYLLDTLKPGTAPGELGEVQLAWLAKALDAKPDKPAVVLTHHQPDLTAKPKGLIDTKALLDVLSPRKQVKVQIYGHTHDWKYAKQTDGLHWLNLPPTGYVFAKGRPAGWTDVNLTDTGLTAQLICLDEQHKQHREKHDLVWR